MPPTLYRRYEVTMCGVLNWSEGFQVISRVPREVETSFNEEASLQAASDTCHYATGWRVRGVVSSDFWWFFEYRGFLIGFFIPILGFLFHLHKKISGAFLGSLRVT
jgi:hypothetical protein